MRSIRLLLISTLIANSPLLAQKADKVSIQAGYLYSTSKFTRTSTALIGIPDADPKPGFYAGLTYEHQLSTLLTSQLELTYQQKGYRSQRLFGDATSNYTYRYLGITPMIGIQPVKNLRCFIGPELNLLLNRSTIGGAVQPITSGSKLMEFGLMGRSSYQFNRVGLTVGYFRGLTAYYKSDFHYLTNQNWQVGLLYQISKR